MPRFSLKSSLLLSSLLLLPIFGFLFWHLSSSETLSSFTENYQSLGAKVTEDLESLPSVVLTEEAEAYSITDAYEAGIDIQFAGKEQEAVSQGSLNLTFPKDYSKPLEVKLDDQKTISITDLSGKDGYRVDTLTPARAKQENKTFFERLFPEQDSPNYLRYQNDRKSLLYAYQRDQATGEKKLKHWTLYEEGVGTEQESYRIDNAKVKLNERGEAEVFYFGQKELQNEQVKAEVGSNLLERAQRTLEKELGEDILNSGTPDFVIPKPYYLDNEGTKHDAEWKWSEEGKMLSVSFSPESYPVALDPTLQFSASGMSVGGSIIDGENSSDQVGWSLTSGDFNADGRMDLAVGANGYASGTGRAYIFYNDGAFATNAGGADKIITGNATSDLFGTSLVAGDLNADGRTDLVVSATGYSSSTGRAYIFYMDSGIPATAATADVTITGGATNDVFGTSLATGDLNADGRTDLVVGAPGHSSSTGRAYIFHNDGSIPTTAGTADVTITGGATGNNFGSALITGDFNSDSKIDLAVGASGYSSSTGRAYIFHNDGSIPTTAGTADITITGGATGDEFGYTLEAGDLNTDGRTDLVVGAWAYTGFAYTGRVYIFHNDGSIPTTAGTADVTITGEGVGSDEFGKTIEAGDFNADGRTDLAVGAPYYDFGTSRMYIFYNDGSIPTTAATADVIIAGNGEYFGASLTAGDFNADGRTDLVVGAYQASAGRVYVFYSQNGQVNTNQTITGNAGSDSFSYSMITGDFNADGRIDLAAGASGYSASTGRTYIFYGDGQISTGASSADVTITGNATGDYFGWSLVAGDFNADGETDLAIGAKGYSSSTGRAYIFHNDGSIPTTAATADVTITGGATGDIFGYTLTSGDFNADGETDLAVGAISYNPGGAANTGRAYIFHNDGSVPTTAGTADVTITGNATGDYFGIALAAGDLNGDGTTDLISGATGYSSSTGRAYIFHNDGSIPTTAATADVTITGNATSDFFATALATGDLNTDGKTDLVVGAEGYSSFTGRVYIFHNDGSVPTTAGTADVTLTGGATDDSFGYALVAGDLNADGRTDLAVGAPHHYATGAGHTYLFYNDGSIPTTAATADVNLTDGLSDDYFGFSLAAGDLNGDGRVDLAVGASGYSSDTGRVYLYETRENFAWTVQRVSGGSASRVNSSTAGEEIVITGEAASAFGFNLQTGDLNTDGKPDLIVSAVSYASSTGRVYIFYNDGNYPASVLSADIIITGGATGDSFGDDIVTGDFNADGRIDLLVTSDGYGTSDGRAYLFYNDGSIPTTAATADVTITGENNSTFGDTAIAGDFNADGETDFAIGAGYYSSNYTGRVYVFYNDGSYASAAGSADAIMTGASTNDNFGEALAAGDLNSDGKTDLIVGAWGAAATYIFYNGSIATETATGADVTITGSVTYFGWSVAAGDFNADSRTDLAIGNTEDSGTAAGDIYFFYNDGSMPTTSGTADDTIAAETSGDLLSWYLAAGDFNQDGKTDLASGAPGYGTDVGRSYVFYNDGDYPSSAASADLILTGEANNTYFGRSLKSGDFNSDGKTDIAVGGSSYSSSAGRTYIYTFNDTVTTGGATSNNFGYSLTSGDFNADGRADLAVGAYAYNPGGASNTGRAYIFYSDGQIPSGASTADVTITGGAASNNFGIFLASGDLNADGKTDLVVSANNYSSGTGRVYIFHNDGSIPTTAGTADVTITGNATSDSFGVSLATGDFNADGKTDLAVGAQGYSGGGSTGRVYIFHNDGSIPTTAGTADVTITGESSNDFFGNFLAAGDFNADGKTDLAASASFYSAFGGTGRVYIFNNDGSIPTTAATADAIITGETTNTFLGIFLTSGDFNADGKTDLAVGASGYSTNTGRVYIFYNGSITTENATGADVTITGNATSDSFGVSLATGDFNADGKTDLAVGAQGYSGGGSTGRVYIFHNDGSIPTTAGTADVTLTGETTNNFFGRALTTGDFNSDGIIDLVVGAYGYSSSTGRVYTFITEIANASSTYRSPSTGYTGTVNLKGTGKMKGTGKIK